MRQVLIKMHDVEAGILVEDEEKNYRFQYYQNYAGPAISLTMPVREAPYLFKKFPPFFDGLLPEGIQLVGLLKIHKIDREDFLTQLKITGNDLVGAVTVFPLAEESHE